MQVAVRSSGIASLIGAVVALSLSAGSAWAGGAGGDAATLQNTLDGACSFLQVPLTSCPQLPTVTQLVLEIAGLESAPPEVPRFGDGIVPTVAINAVNPPAGQLPFSLSNVSPLAFISTSGRAAAVAQPDDPLANSFFYAATDGARKVAPTTLSLVYDYPDLTNPHFAKGQLVAEISLPLVVLNSNGTESEAPTTIEIRGAAGCGQIVPCVSATAAGNFGSGLQSVDAANLGLTVTATFQSSPNSPTSHLIFGVQAKLLVTHQNDPAYFAPAPVFFPPAFLNDELGVTPKFLGLPVGIAPYAAPKCTSVSCPPPTTPPTPNPSNFPFCASIAPAPGASLAPAVAAFFSVGTAGTTYLSAPLPQFASSLVTCPF